MGSKNKMAITYSNEGLNELLAQFQKSVDEGKYTERIPYVDWRKIKKMSFAVIEYESPFVWIKEHVVNECGDDEWVAVLSYKSYDNGFGRFFYDIYVKEQRNMDYKTVSVKLREDSPAGTAYWTYDDSLNLTNTHLYDSASLTVSGDARIDGAVYINDCGSWDTAATASSVSSLEKRISDIENNMNKDNKENENMNTNKFMNFEFGPVSESSIRMSLYGLAVKNVSGTWVSYDASTRSIMDVDILNFNGRQFMYKVPVAIEAVAVGDIVIHARKPMFVTEVKANSLMAIDPIDGEYKEIVLTKSPFGFNFVTKVVNLMNGFMNTPASKENPFGNMWMLMALNGDEGKDIDPMMLMLMMGGGKMGEMNPMMMYALMGGNKNQDMLPLLMMSGMFNSTTEHKCSCGGNCENHNN